MNFTNNQLQHILREAFSDGIPLFTSHVYRAPEQLESAVFSFRNTLLNSGKKPDEYFFWFLRAPGRFDMPDETSYFIGLKDFYKRDKNYPSCDSDRTPWIRETKQTQDELITTLKNSNYLAVRALLNTRLFLRHPNCLLSLKEFKTNPHSQWEYKFPIPKGEIIDTRVSQEQIYGDLGTGVGEILAEFFGAMGSQLSQQDINKINNEVHLNK